MNEIAIFNNEAFGSVRVVEGDAPMFVAMDVTKILGYGNGRDALQKHVDEDDVAKCDIKDPRGRRQQTNVINESGLYSLIMSSKLPQAKQFKKWVTSEVLPSIRKKGGYMVAKTSETPEETLARAFLIAQDTIARKDGRIRELEEENEKKALFIEQIKDRTSYVDMVLSCKSVVPINSIAKDYGMNARSMNLLLHDLGIQYKQSDQWLLYAKYENQGYARGVDIPIEKDGVIIDYKRHTQWTQKGRLFIYEQLKAAGILPLIERESASEELHHIPSYSIRQALR